MQTYEKFNALSKNRFYELYIRRLNVLELKDLAEKTIDELDDAVDRILRNMLAEKGFDYSNLLLGDRLQLLVTIRVLTLNSSIISVPFVCKNKKCSYTNSDEIVDINEFEQVELNDDFELVDNELKLNDKDTIYIALPKVYHKEKVAKFIREHSNMYFDEKILFIASLISFKKGEINSLLKVYEWLINLDPIDYVKIENFISKMNFGLLPIALHKCPKCKEVSPIGLVFQRQFFTPDYTI